MIFSTNVLIVKMKKQCFIDQKNHEIICACSPTVPNEVSRWYNEEHGISIASYGKLINNVVNCVGASDIKLISCFTFYDRPNLLTQKKGMRGVFSKFNVDYQSAFESLIEVNGKISFISIAQAPLQNLNSFFIPEVQSVICLNCNISDTELMCQARKCDWEEFVHDLTQKSEVLITFLDAGCDGNSTKFHFKTFSDALISQLCDFAAMDNYEIVKRND